MKKYLSVIILLCASGVSSLHAYTSKTVSNTVQSFITAPTYFQLQGVTLASPLSQYTGAWTGEALLAKNGTFTGKGTIISYANGATNSTQNSFTLVSPSLIKGPVLLEDYVPTTNTYVNQNYYGNDGKYVNVTSTSTYTKYVYSSDCILTAINSTTRFLLKGRISYEVSVNKYITPKYVTPSYVSFGYTTPPYTNSAYTNISTNTFASLSLAAFSTNNTFWGFISGNSN